MIERQRHFTVLRRSTTARVLKAKGRRRRLRTLRSVQEGGEIELMLHCHSNFFDPWVDQSDTEGRELVF